MGLVDESIKGCCINRAEQIFVALLLLLHGKRFAQGEILSCADI